MLPLGSASLQAGAPPIVLSGWSVLRAGRGLPEGVVRSYLGARLCGRTSSILEASTKPAGEERYYMPELRTGRSTPTGRRDTYERATSAEQGGPIGVPVQRGKTRSATQGEP